MKHFAAALSGLLFSIIFSSCNKDKDPQPAEYPNYSQLKTGNYWIYQQFQIDSSGNATALNVFDSCYVEKDTLINGLLYYLVFRPSVIPFETYSLLRDSLHYIVDINGEIQFSSYDFSTVFNDNHITTSPGTDTIAYVTKKMEDKDMIVNTPLGIYFTSNFRETFNFYGSWAAAGNPRYRHKRYAQHVGIVIETLAFYSSNPDYIERRLVRYHLN